MIIKVTATGRNEAIYVNFDYVRTMCRNGAFTELVMSDDKYHKLAVTETPEEIYEKLYPTNTCSGNCHCHDKAEAESVQEVSVEASAVKKTSTKKAQAKAVEDKTTEEN
jgi:hypothetical protein